MASLFIGLLTLIMVLDCMVLIFLVLIQLPKKEAGAGLAFGGAATDALFGAGSGNVLTKVTKYSAGIFFVLALLLSAIQTSRFQRRTSTGFEQKVSQPLSSPMNPLAQPTAPQTAPATAPTQPTVPPGTGTVTMPQVEQPVAKPVAPPVTAPPPTVPSTNASATPAPTPTPVAPK